MSDVVGGSERKTVCVMSSHFPLHIHVFSLQKQVAGATEKEFRKNGSLFHQAPELSEYSSQAVFIND